MWREIDVLVCKTYETANESNNTQYGLMVINYENRCFEYHNFSHSTDGISKVLGWARQFVAAKCRVGRLGPDARSCDRNCV